MKSDLGRRLNKRLNTASVDNHRGNTRRRKVKQTRDRRTGITETREERDLKIKLEMTNSR